MSAGLWGRGRGGTLKQGPGCVTCGVGGCRGRGVGGGCVGVCVWRRGARVKGHGRIGGAAKGGHRPETQARHEAIGGTGLQTTDRQPHVHGSTLLLDPFVLNTVTSCLQHANGAAKGRSRADSGWVDRGLWAG